MGAGPGKAATAIGAMLSLVGAVDALAAFPGADGRIAYDFGGQVRTVEPDGSDARAVTEGVAPSWSPDGTRLVFNRLTGRANEVMIANADGTDARVIADAGTYDQQYDAQPSFSPDGHRIVYSTVRAIFTVRTDGTDRERVVSGMPIGGDGPPCCVRDPVYSPDGRRIAFGGVPRGKSGAGIWTVRPNGTGLRRLTRTRGVGDTSIDFSPDGRRILFHRLTPDQKGAFLMRSDGTHLRPLSLGAFPYGPVFSPSGTRFAFGADGSEFAYQDGCLEVFTAAAGGVGLQRVTHGCPSLGVPSLSWQPLPG